jgi:formylglycine-generating enzyme required for sulfatase activity
MKTTTVRKLAAACLTALLAFGAMADDPVISQVTVRQRWPWSRLVDIDYVLTCDATQRVDVVLTASDGSTPLTLPPGSLTGDIYGISHGLRRIVWDPMKTVYTNDHLVTQFRVALTPTPVPLYMIVDLTKEAGAEGQIEYVYPGDARLETYDRFTNVWFGVTNDSVYATDKLVLRRVSAGTFGMGTHANIPTTLTKDFYSGVFEVTHRQWELTAGNRPSYFAYYPTRPVERSTYVSIRGSTNSTPSIDWPSTGNAVATDSFLGKLRTKTGMDGFDLPTEAQWEYLCRAGTTTYYSDGLGNPANTSSNAQMDVLGRYSRNGGQVWDGSGWKSPAASCGPTNATALAGSYMPNGWGVYDTHGNVYEWCLDYHAIDLSGGIDPKGSVSGPNRTRRGGAYGHTADASASAFRQGVDPTINYYDNTGLRLVLRLP